LHEGPALVELGDITWDRWVAQIPVTILEQDDEDQPFVRANVFLNEQLVQRVTLGGEGWEDDRKTITISQDVAWAQGRWTRRTQPLSASRPISRRSQSGWRPFTSASTGNPRCGRRPATLRRRYTRSIRSPSQLRSAARWRPLSEGGVPFPLHTAPALSGATHVDDALDHAQARGLPDVEIAGRADADAQVGRVG